ncbi:MAG: metal ABC transporter permease [Deltaproteobacteria bacterium]|jgi:zinc transport system permease protein|nr:metal ABC transporter permease [Deltaproteobacteria bacterium]
MELMSPFYELAGLVYQPGFMRRSAAALFFLTLTASAVGVLVVNRRMAFFPDAVGHSVFVGVALALILNIGIQPTVLFLGLIIGLLIIFLSRHGKLAPDTVIGLTFSGAVALGLALVSREPQATAGLTKFFLGDVLTVTDGQVLSLGFLTLLSIIFLLFLTNRLTLASIVPRVKAGTELAEYLFGAFLSVVVMLAVQAVGVLLVTALLVAPAATGRVLASSFKAMFLSAVVCGVIAGQAGLWASSQPSINTSVGATVVLANVFLFGLAVVFRRFRPDRG